MPKYDAVILGAGVAGCAVAASLAKAGKRVMIMDPAATPGGSAASVELQGRRISGWPTCAYGFEEAGAWNTVLDGLGLHYSVSVRGATYQVALPGRRITVSPDASMTLEELRREYPAEIDVLRKFYRDVNALGSRMSRNRMSAYLARRRKAEDFLRSYCFSKELLAFFSASSFFFFGRSVQKVSLAQLVVLVATPPRYITEGFERIAGDLCELVTRLGGECRLGEPWPELLVRRSRLEGMETSRGRIDLRTAVLNVPWRVWEKTLFSVVREEVLPVGMRDTVLVVRDYDRPEESMVLSLDARISPGEPAGGLRSLRAFFLRREVQDATPEELIGKMSRIVPFLANFTEAAVLRDGMERAIEIPRVDDRKQPQRTAERGHSVRLPIRSIYVLDDAPVGIARQGSTARALATRLI